MPVSWLKNDHRFPPADQAEEGIVALGGDLHPDRLYQAYRQGIFPWYNEDEPIIWWSPDPRFVLFPNELKVSASMKQLLKRETYKVTYNQHFEEVMSACATSPRQGQQGGTWINEEMITAYTALFNKGLARSVEVWQGNELVGGLYGVQVGKIFCGESMFHRANNASKYGFICLTQRLISEGCVLIDCQLHTTHLESLGARNIPRATYLKILLDNLS